MALFKQNTKLVNMNFLRKKYGESNLRLKEERICVRGFARNPQAHLRHAIQGGGFLGVM